MPTFTWTECNSTIQPMYYNSTCTQVWPSWIEGTGTNTATISNVVVWQYWASTCETVSVTVPNNAWPRQMTPEEEQARYIAMRRAAHHHREDLAKRKRAARVARQLLMRNLSRQQRRQYRANKRFDVIGGTTGRRYRIREGHVGNIDVYEGERIIHRLCCHIPTDCPTEDIMLAQALHLAANEDEFVRTANVHPVR